MAKGTEVNDPNFAAFVNLLTALESVYIETEDQSLARIRIVKTINESMPQLSDEQVPALAEWWEDRVEQGQQELSRLKEKLEEIEAELARRRRGEEG